MTEGIMYEHNLVYCLECHKDPTRPFDKDLVLDSAICRQDTQVLFQSYEGRLNPQGTMFLEGISMLGRLPSLELLGCPSTHCWSLEVLDCQK